MNLTCINLAFAGYLLAGIFYFSHSIFRAKQFFSAATALLAIGFILHTIFLINRWQAAGRFPVVGLYESLLFLDWALMLVYLGLKKLYKLKGLEIPVTLLAVLALGYISILDKSIKPLLPVLKSNWITIHVLSYFIGYAGVTISFFQSIAYLKRTKTASSDSLAQLDNLSYRMVSFAFPFLTIGLTTGAVWAKTAWGSYWSWDPKETWALISWCIYAAYLHLRLLKNWPGRRTAYLNILGFLCILFTFFGVNYLRQGLHSYL